MKKILLAVAVAAVATMGVVSSASAAVPRYQPTATLTVSLPAIPGNAHTFTIEWTNPCGTDGAFTGTGQGSATAGGATETISGSLVGEHLTFTATYTSFIPGYTYTYDGPLSGGPLGGAAVGYDITASVETIESVRNHGEYVAAKGGGSDAAHSCIGMPIS